MISLDPSYYRRIDDTEARFPEGAPSLVGCETLCIVGDVKFGRNVSLEGNVELIAGIKLVLTGGHTMGHQGLIVESEGERLFLFADIVPFQAHIRPAYVASADLFPLETIKIKKELLPEIAQHGWYLGFDHEIDIKVCRIVDNGMKLVAEKVEV